MGPEHTHIDLTCSVIKHKVAFHFSESGPLDRFTIEESFESSWFLTVPKRSFLSIKVVLLTEKHVLI